MFGLSAEQLYNILSSNLLFPFLVVALFWVNHTIQKDERKNARELLEQTKKESQSREDKLMDHLTVANETHQKIASSLERLEYRMEAIERKIS